MRRILSFLLALIMMLTLFPMAALAEGVGEPPVFFYDKSTAFPMDGYDYKWNTLPDDTPILQMAPTEITDTNANKSLYFFPVWLSSEAPKGLNSDSGLCYPFAYYQDGDSGFYDNDNLLIEEIDGEEYFHFDVKVPVDNPAVEDAFIIHWFSERTADGKPAGNLLAVTMLHFSVSDALVDPFDNVQKPSEDRVSFSVPGDLADDGKPVAINYNETTGELTFTVDTPSKEDIRSAYFPGMTEILGSFIIQAPAGYTELCSISGNGIDYERFKDYYSNAPFNKYNGVGNGVRLYQIDENGSNIVVTPGTYGVNICMCWRKDTGELLEEILYAKLVVKDESQVTIPKADLPQATPVPASRMAVGKIPDDSRLCLFNDSAIGGVFTATDGLARFTYEKDPSAIIEYAQSQSPTVQSIRQPLWITPPEGYTHYELVGGGPSDGIREIPTFTYDGTSYTVFEFDRPIYDERNGIVTRNEELTIAWSNPTTNEVVKYESFTYQSDFPGRTWMDAYWAPLPEESLRFEPASLNGLPITKSFDGYTLTLAFNEDRLPTFAEMEAAQLARFGITPPEGAVTCVSNQSSGDRSNGYNPTMANEMYSWLNAVKPEDRENAVSFARGLAAINKKNAGNEGIEYFVVEQERNRIILIQFYDAAGNLIKVGKENDKNGYYLHIDFEPFVYTLAGSIVNTVSSAVTKPTLALGEGVDIKDDWYFTAQLHPQKETQGKLKYFLELFTNVPEEILKNGVQVYIPGSLLETHGNGNANVSWETAIKNKHTLTITHYFSDAFEDSETPGAEYSDYGILFECKSFSPFVFEAEDPADDNEDPDTTPDDDNQDGSGEQNGSSLPTIKPAGSSNAGSGSNNKFQHVTEPTDNSLGADIDMSLGDIVDSVLTEQEQNGSKPIEIELKVKDAEQTMPASEKKAFQKASEGDSIVMYLDITLNKQVGNGKQEKISETNGPVKISLQVPASAINHDPSISRIYYMMHLHNGVMEKIYGSFDPLTNTFSFETDCFSPYALAYTDTLALLGVPKTGGNSSNILGLALLAAGICAAGLTRISLKKKR